MRRSGQEGWEDFKRGQGNLGSLALFWWHVPARGKCVPTGYVPFRRRASQGRRKTVHRTVLPSFRTKSASFSLCKDEKSSCRKTAAFSLIHIQQSFLYCLPAAYAKNKPPACFFNACGVRSLFYFFVQTQQKAPTFVSAFDVGGSYRARTCDPLLVRQMLSQLS